MSYHFRSSSYFQLYLLFKISPTAKRTRRTLMEHTFYNFLWLFFIYSLLGWCGEVAYVALKEGHFVNRGFLNGPLCPIYGAGALCIHVLLFPHKDNKLILFLGSMLLASLIELIAGFLLDKIFHHRWWDYSNIPFNLGGYICPLFSLLWGSATMIVVDTVHPLVLKFIAFLPETLGLILLSILLLYFIIDLVATVRSVLNLNKRLRRIDELGILIHEGSDTLGKDISKGVLDFADYKKSLEEKRKAKRDSYLEEINLRLEKQHADLSRVIEEWQSTREKLLKELPTGQHRLLKAFPKLKSRNHTSALEKIKEALAERKESSTEK